MDAHAAAEALFHDRVQLDAVEPDAGCARRGADHGGLAAAEHDSARTASVPGVPRAGVRSDETPQQRDYGVVFRGLELLAFAVGRRVVGHELRREDGWPPRRAHEVRVEPRCEFVGVRHGRRERDDPRASFRNAEPRDHRLERRAAGRVTDQMDFVDDEASDAADDVLQ